MATTARAKAAPATTRTSMMFTSYGLAAQLVERDHELEHGHLRPARVEVR
jgi:hypothetical protein